MIYRFNFHDVRDGGFIITHYEDFECDTDAIMRARHSLDNQSNCGRVDVFLMKSEDAYGPIQWIDCYKL